MCSRTETGRSFSLSKSSARFAERSQVTCSYLFIRDERPPGAGEVTFHGRVELGAHESVVEREPLRRRQTPSAGERDRGLSWTSVVDDRFIGETGDTPEFRGVDRSPPNPD